MFKEAKRKVSTETKNENIDDDEDKNAAKKKKLLTEIKTLKLLITQAECNLEPMRFRDLKREEIGLTQASSVAGASSSLLDIETTFQNELCTYAGFRCKKMGDGFVFAFRSSNGNLEMNQNWIELFNDEKCWKLGKWSAPLDVDIGAIFAEYRMESSSDMKYFLRECKHAIDCRYRREQDFKELQAFMSHMRRYGCYVDGNYGYTSVTMKLVKKLGGPSNEARNIIVHLIYKYDGARPYKMRIDCEGENELSTDCQKEYARFFQSFKQTDLVDAAKRTLTSPDSPFIWKDASNDDSIIYESNGKEAKKRRRDDSEVDESADDERENDLSIEALQVSNPDISDGEVSQIDSHRSKKPKRATKKRKLSTVKKTDPAARKSGVKKINAVAKTKDRENVPVITISDKSRTRRASTKESLPMKDCNDNVVNSQLKENPSKTTGKPSNNNDKVESTVPKMFQLNRRTSGVALAGDNEKSLNSNDKAKSTVPKMFQLNKRTSRIASTGGNEKASKNNDKVKLAGPKFFQLQKRASSSHPASGNEKPSKNNDKFDNNNEKSSGKVNSVPQSNNLEINQKKSVSSRVKSVTTPNSRSTGRLLCSTPISGCIALYTVAEDNISAIAKENTCTDFTRALAGQHNTVVPRRLVDVEENRTKSDNDCSIIDESDESDEKDIAEVYNNQSALLKDIQDVKYNNNNAMEKVTAKSIKRQRKATSRGRNKISK